MRQLFHCAPANPCVFLSDRSGGEPPDPANTNQIKATSSCIMIACMSDVEGGSDFLVCSGEDLQPVGSPSFESELQIPACNLMLSTAQGDVLFESSWSAPSVHVRIWPNRPLWPNYIIIELS